MVKKIILVLDNFMKRYTPDPFIYALILTLIVFFFGALTTDHSLIALSQMWSKGFWGLANFTLHMAMILFLGYVLAVSKPVKNILERLSSLPKNINQAAVFCVLVSSTACLLNWGFGLIVSAVFCKNLGNKFAGKNFRLLTAFSYSGFLLWHGGLSGSIPLVISTKGNFSEAMIGSTIPLSDSIFSSVNLFIVLAHFLVLPWIAWKLSSSSFASQENLLREDENQINPEKNAILTPAESLEFNVYLVLPVIAIAGLAVFGDALEGSLKIDLNQVNFLFFILALVLHRNVKNFLSASAEATKKIWPILVQYPLYAALMAVMQKSGLAATISDAFVNAANKQTLPLLVYYSAGLVNIFIPSGGGQWAVQAPMVVSAAKQLGADLNSCIMAVAWGDAWTNMVQPFWALPLLTIAGLKARDIMAPLLVVFIASGIITSFAFILFSLN